MSDRPEIHADQGALIRSALRAVADAQEPDSGFQGVALAPCASCGNDDVETRQDVQTFQYGVGDDAVRLSAVVPVRVCKACGFEYLDSAAESARHDAVCRHLGVMTPGEVKGVRKRYGKSR